MPSRRRRRAKPLLSCALSPFRALFVVGFVAAARALGGPREVPKPPPRNLPAKLERKR